MLIVTRPDLAPADFERLRRLLVQVPYDLRWIRRRRRLVVLLRHGSAEDEALRPLVEDPAVAYVLRDPSEREISRVFSRRDLIDLALTTTGILATAALFAPLSVYLTSPASEITPGGDVLLGSRDDIPLNSARTRVVDGEDFLVVRTGQAQYHALTRTCTHSNACLVEWSAELGEIVCPCHRGIFDRYGNVISGPPPRPLEYREVFERDGNLYMKRKAR